MYKFNHAHTEQRGAYMVVLSIAPEIEDPRDHLWNADIDVDELMEEIEDGRMLWFVARVEVGLDGALIATEYLNGCAYRSVEEFLADGYYKDMVRNAVATADEWLERLLERMRVEV